MQPRNSGQGRTTLSEKHESFHVDEDDERWSSRQRRGRHRRSPGLAEIIGGAVLIGLLIFTGRAVVMNVHMTEMNPSVQNSLQRITNGAIERQEIIRQRATEQPINQPEKPLATQVAEELNPAAETFGRGMQKTVNEFFAGTNGMMGDAARASLAAEEARKDKPTAACDEPCRSASNLET